MPTVVARTWKQTYHNFADRFDFADVKLTVVIRTFSRMRCMSMTATSVFGIVVSYAILKLDPKPSISSRTY